MCVHKNKPKIKWITRGHKIARKGNLYCSVLLVSSQHPKVYSSFPKCADCFWYTILVIIKETNESKLPNEQLIKKIS